MSAQIRILLVDDHAVMRAGLENVLNSNADFHVIAGASNASEALRLVVEHQPDVILLDVNMPGVSGIECLKSIRAKVEGAKVVMLTSSEAEEDVFQALEAGALGYVLKTACPEELTEVIYAASNGRRVVSPAIEAHLLNRASSASLTPREIEVLQYIRKGMSNAEIGELLGFTLNTAKAHVAALLKKLNASDRAEAVARAFERGLLKL